AALGFVIGIRVTAPAVRHALARASTVSAQKIAFGVVDVLAVGALLQPTIAVALVAALGTRRDAELAFAGAAAGLDGGPGTCETLLDRAISAFAAAWFARYALTFVAGDSAGRAAGDPLPKLGAMLRNQPRAAHLILFALATRRPTCRAGERSPAAFGA